MAPLLESEGLDLGMSDLQYAIIVQDRMVMMDQIHLESIYYCFTQVFDTEIQTCAQEENSRPADQPSVSEHDCWNRCDDKKRCQSNVRKLVRGRQISITHVICTHSAGDDH